MYISKPQLDGLGFGASFMAAAKAGATSGAKNAVCDKAKKDVKALYAKKDLASWAKAETARAAAKKKGCTIPGEAKPKSAAAKPAAKSATKPKVDPWINYPKSGQIMNGELSELVENNKGRGPGVEWHARVYGQSGLLKNLGGVWTDDQLAKALGELLVEIKTALALPVTAEDKAAAGTGGPNKMILIGAGVLAVVVLGLAAVVLKKK